MNWIVVGVLTGVLVLAGCTPPVSRHVEEVVVKPVVPPLEELEQRLAAVPGGTVARQPDRLELRFADGTLFAHDAVLPLPGGKSVLDPLAALLRDYPQVPWRLVVAAATDHGEDYNRHLAEKRSELLQKYLQRHGVAPGSVEMVPDVGHEQPVTLVYPLPSGGSSSSMENE